MQQATLALIELHLGHLCGTGRQSHAPVKQLHPQARTEQAGPSLLQNLRSRLKYVVPVIRYWLKYGAFARGRHSSGALKDPRTIPAVPSPEPASCMCCWFQQQYNPERPAGLFGRGCYNMQLLRVRLFPPIKPDEVNSMCYAHMDLLYPPRRARAAGQSGTSLAAAGAAQAMEVSA